MNLQTFLRRKYRWSLTPIGALTLAILLLLIALIARNNLYQILAIHVPIKSDAYIVEGWIPDYDIELFLKTNPISPDTIILITGGKIPKGSHLSQFSDYATLTAFDLRRLGPPTDRIFPISSETVESHRTLTTAVAVNNWLESHPNTQSATLVTLGPHARRSYNTYKKALNDSFKLGVISLPPEDYDPKKWWTTSAGFKTVTYEAIAYAYSIFEN